MKLKEIIKQSRPLIDKMMLQVIDSKGKQLYFGRTQYCGEVLLNQELHIPTTVNEDIRAMTVTVVVKELK